MYYYNERGTKENFENYIGQLKRGRVADWRGQGEKSTSPATVDFLVMRIEQSDLSVEEKIRLEEKVQVQMSPSWGGINWLTRSLYNVVLAIKNGSGFVGGTQVASLNSLRKYAVIYSEQKTVRVVQVIPAIEGVAPQSEVVVSKEITVYRLTHYGQRLSQPLYNKGMEIAQNEISKLKAIGVLS